MTWRIFACDIKYTENKQDFQMAYPAVEQTDCDTIGDFFREKICNSEF